MSLWMAIGTYIGCYFYLKKKKNSDPTFKPKIYQTLWFTAFFVSIAGGVASILISDAENIAGKFGDSIGAVIAFWIIIGSLRFIHWIITKLRQE